MICSILAGIGLLAVLRIGWLFVRAFVPAFRSSFRESWNREMADVLAQRELRRLRERPDEERP